MKIPNSGFVYVMETWKHYTSLFMTNLFFFFCRNLNCVFFCATVETLYFSIQNRFSLAIIVSFWITHIISLAGKKKIRNLWIQQEIVSFCLSISDCRLLFLSFRFPPGNAKNSWTGNLYTYLQPTKSYEVQSCKIYVPPLIYRLPSWSYKWLRLDIPLWIQFH